MSAPVVFFDIAGPDLERQSAFYSAVFGWDVAPSGRFSVEARATLAGTLRADPAEKVIYLGVDDVSAALAKIEAHGGRTIAPRMAVPGVVILALFEDPAGNRMGLIEMDADNPKVP